MPSLEAARRIASIKYNGANTIGQIYKEESDFMIEQTWMNDIQSKICYIYDYFHDDQPHLKENMTYENTTKTKIAAKFIIKSYQSIDKDQVEYYVQFKPSQSTKFTPNDELYYFETDYRSKYGNDDFIGLYIDIPDDSGIYRKWLICYKELANQFTKYLILPVTYHLKWVEKNGQNRYKRQMWAVLRNQQSYTIGQYTDKIFTRPDNQQKLWLPLNHITEKFWYTDDSNKTMRLVVSAPTELPVVWSVTKIENIQPIGIQKLTLYQNIWNEQLDYIERDKFGNIIGMYANYFDSNIVPQDNTTLPPTHTSLYGKIIASNALLKVGGNYKTLTLKIFDENDIEITEQYSKCKFEWTGNIIGIDNFDKEKNIIWKNGESFNQKKIKFKDNRMYLNKVLEVKCIVYDDKFNLIETIFKFDLVI